MEKFLFSVEAVGYMMVECYWKNDNLETGGILIGQHKRIITDIIPSSAYAERSPATYYQSEKDVEILNQKLRQFQAKGFDFVGYWHKHPSGMSRLSHGDLNTCSEILKSPNYKINNHLIMCIVTESHIQNFPIFSYVVSLRNNRVVVEEAATKILPKTCILECAECFEPLKGETSHEDNDTGQDYRRTETNQRDSVVRNTGEEHSDSKLPRPDHRAGENRSVSQGKRGTGLSGRDNSFNNNRGEADLL